MEKTKNATLAEATWYCHANGIRPCMARAVAAALRQMQREGMGDIRECLVKFRAEAALIARQPR